MTGALRHRWPQALRTCAVGLLALTTIATAQSVSNANPDAFEYEGTASASDAKFGAQLGAGSKWQSKIAATPSAPGTVGFGGGVRLGCFGLDFNGFLRAFDPTEILSEMRTALLNGTQAAASNYLITLAYASPTIASVLDMMDKKYTARFSSFAQTCDAQAARARGQDRGARALAAVGNQCYDEEISRGTAPTEAYRRCSIQRNFEGMNLPAAASTADFLRTYTHIDVTPQIEVLLNLLPDERIQNGAFQMQAPRTTVAAMSNRLRILSRLALEQLDAGTAPAAIPVCDAGNMLGGSESPNGCLPAEAAPLVTSSAFRSSRLLGSASRALFNDALSTQIAIGNMYSNLLELFQQSARIDLRAAGSGDAAHALERRRQLRESLSELLAEADAQVKAQAARGQLVRMQMMALEQVEQDMNARARRNADAQQVPQFGVRDLLGLFSGGN
jgi:hypothetical protein